MLSPLLPEIEYKLLCRAVEEACRHLNAGDRDAGEQCLRAGLERACEFANGDEPWAEDLVRSYLAALEQYSRLETCAPPPSMMRHVQSRAGAGSR